MQLRAVLAANLVAFTLAGCASLQGLRALVQPPRFEEAANRQSEIRLLPVGLGRPAGGATVRLWTTVTNPNPFGFTLSTVQTTLLLEGVRAADAEFPLGLPLEPRQSETIPFDLTVSFANLPGLASVIRQAASGAAVEYQLDGTVGIDAGRLGQPTFGPMTLLRGDLRGQRIF